MWSLLDLAPLAGVLVVSVLSVAALASVLVCAVLPAPCPNLRLVADFNDSEAPTPDRHLRVV
jgi:hypothetical protein